VVATIREHLREQNPDGGYTLRNNVLALGDLLRMKLPDDRTLRVDDADIEDLLSERKGAYTFIVLSLLYPHLRFDQVQFHQDHIHPFSQFTDARLRRLGLDPDRVRAWQEDRDRLPNLQLMEGSENKSKNDTPFELWVDTLDGKKEHFLLSNRIPSEVSLSLSEFETFFAARKQILQRELKAILASGEEAQRSAE
jgi:hypothetical protein